MARGVFGFGSGWRRMVRRGSTVLAAAVSLTLVVDLLCGVPPAVARGGGQPDGPEKSSVAVRPVKPRAASRSQTDGPGVTRLDHAALPGGGSADLAVTGTAASVGGVPVSLSTSTDESLMRPAGVSAESVPVAPPRSVRVAVAAPTVASAAGVRGVVLSLSRSDGDAAAGPVHLRVDYSLFANAFGGDFANRLRLVRLPACALTTPDVPACQQQTPVASTNAGGAVSADLAVSGATSGTATAATVVALASSPSSAGGTFSATSLKPSYAWASGTSSGSFSWQYPMKVPPSIGGPEPDVSLDYDSGGVDAQTWAQNGQTSWAGEGFDLQSGYVERSYRSCNDDGGSTGDLCWFSSYNATMVFKGQSTALVRDATTGVWHGQSDSGLKVEQLFDTSRGNGDNDGEYWRVTTQDGTQYYFGLNKRYAGDPASTSSVLTEPVYGNNSGEPCYNATFANASCQQGYRWNLDYVVDRRGNSMTYFYTKFSGYYGHNSNTGVAPYDLSGTLDHVDYGTRAGSEGSGSAPMQVWLVKSGRCNGGCAQNTSDYPDTPWDLYCSSTTSCPNTTSPVFFTPYKLSSVYSQVWDPAKGGYRKVDQWDLAYTYPATGDNISPAGNDTAPNLWLQTLTRTGYAADGSSLAEPTITFGGSGLFNRVFWGNSISVAPYTHYRLTSINTGSGGETDVSYVAGQCDGTFTPIPDSNPYRCFPEYFKPVQAAAGWGWFQKYVVTQVVDRDLTGGSPDEVSSYTYSGEGSSDASLWHHDYNETSIDVHRSWSLWQGYPSVTVTHGAAGGPQTVTTSTYYRGMDGDAKHGNVDQLKRWGSRRTAVLRPLGTPGVTAALAGAGMKCLDLAGYGTTNGTAVQTWDCTGASNQVWQMVPDGLGDLSLKNPVSGRCLDLSGYGTANGTKVQLWDCTGASNQLFQRRPDGSWFNPVSGRCLDIAGASLALGTPVQLWDCSGAWNQMWQPQSNGAMTNVQASRCVDLAGYGTTN